VLWWVIGQPPGGGTEFAPPPAARPAAAPDPLRAEIVWAQEERPPVADLPVMLAEWAQEIRDDELVVGVIAGGLARAYPINKINGPEREVVNDSLGGLPIVVTWCQFCNHPLVFERTVDDRTLTFGLSGGLWRNNLVLYDRETRSLWSQMLREAIAGPLKGKPLRVVPSVLTDWASWKSRYPATTVLQSDHTFLHYRRSAYRNLEGYVLGISAGQHARAWRLDLLAAHPAYNDQWQGRPVLVAFDPPSRSARLFERTLAGQVLTFQNRDGTLSDESTGSTWDPITGQALSGPLAGSTLTPLPAALSFRDVWLKFHPRSEYVAVPAPPPESETTPGPIPPTAP
jgi:hypothetical protein